MKKKSRSSLVKELDRVFSLYIRKRSPVCFCCGRTVNLTCGHLITRACYSTRWDTENAETQCSGCNMLHEYRPEIYTEKYIEKYGIEKYIEIVKKSKEVRKFKNYELEEMIRRFKNEII